MLAFDRDREGAHLLPDEPLAHFELPALGDSLSNIRAIQSWAEDGTEVKSW